MTKEFDTIEWIKSTGRDPMHVSIEAYRLLEELSKMYELRLSEIEEKVKGLSSQGYLESGIEIELINKSEVLKAIKESKP